MLGIRPAPEPLLSGRRYAILHNPTLPRDPNHQRRHAEGELREGRWIVGLVAGVLGILGGVGGFIPLVIFWPVWFVAAGVTLYRLGRP